MDTEVENMYSSKRPRFQRLRWVLLFLILLVLVVGGHALWSYLNGKSALRDAIAQTDALDPRWRLADLLADRTLVPDDENSAIVIMKAFALEDRSDSKKLADADVFGLDGVWENDQHQLNHEQKKTLDVLLKAQEKSLPEYRKIANMPRGRYPDPKQQDNIARKDDVAIDLPPSTRAREANLALRYGFLDCLDRGDKTGQFQDIRSMMHVAASVGEEPTPFTTYLRFFLRQNAPYTVRRWLAQDQPADAELAVVQQQLEYELQLPLLKNYFRSIRAEVFESFDQVVNNVHRPNRNIDRMIQFLRMRVWDVGSLDRQKAEYLKWMNELVRIASMAPRERLSELAILQKSVDADPELSPLFAFLFNSLKNSIWHSEAMITCAIAALAAERFRIQNQRWPASLEELSMAGFLKFVPVDPYDGKPLRWKTTDTGAMVYSIGRDGVDNGGTTNQQTFNQPDSDIIFRLYDPAHRRLPPLPPKPKPDEPKDQ